MQSCRASIISRWAQIKMITIINDWTWPYKPYGPYFCIKLFVVATERLATLFNPAISILIVITSGTPICLPTPLLNIQALCELSQLPVGFINAASALPLGHQIDKLSSWWRVWLHGWKTMHGWHLWEMRWWGCSVHWSLCHWGCVVAHYAQNLQKQVNIFSNVFHWNWLIRDPELLENVAMLQPG